MFTTLLDTCVLWPSMQRDVLLSLAAEGLFRPAWSSVILAELEYEEAAKLARRGVDPATADRRATHLIQQMRQAFNDAEITGWEGLDGTYGLPDPDDEHVVAAAVVAGAGAIITLNTKDFPAAQIPSGLETLRPADSPLTPCPSTRTAPHTPSAPPPTEPTPTDPPGASPSCSTSSSTGTASTTPSTNSAPSNNPEAPHRALTGRGIKPRAHGRVSNSR